MIENHAYQDRIIHWAWAATELFKQQTEGRIMYKWENWIGGWKWIVTILNFWHRRARVTASELHKYRIMFFNLT